ncbi:MAG: rhodanese-like domain-containing protein [Sulfurimonas sp.]
MQSTLDKSNIHSEELESLLEQRAEGKVDFLLVDVREDMEYEMGHIKGVDLLLPTSTFAQWAEKFAEENKDKNVIFTCRTGNRSGQVQHIFKQHGLENVINHAGGIVTYRGDIEK